MGFKGRRDALRRLGTLAAAAVASMPAAAAAQSPKRLAIFHWLDPKEFEGEYPGLFAALAEKGWKEGVNLTLDWREVRVDNPDLDAIAARLVATAPDVIFTESTRATRALQAATQTIPIVTSVGDPVATRFAASLGRPGGNVTGLALTAGAEGKDIDVTREVVPTLKRMMYLQPSSVTTSREYALQGLAAARQRGVEPRLMLIHPKDAEGAAREAVKWGAGAVGVGGFLEKAPTRVVADAVHAAGLPTVGAAEQFSDSLALTVVLHHANTVKSLSATLDKVLRGTRPAEIAFEPPDSVKIIVNRRILTALRLSVPPTLLVRADRLID